MMSQRIAVVGELSTGYTGFLKLLFVITHICYWNRYLPKMITATVTNILACKRLEVLPEKRMSINQVSDECHRLTGCTLLIVF